MTSPVKGNPVLPARGMSGRQAAAYWGVSPGTFKKMVSLGLAPPPIDLPGIDRQIYDRHEQDRAIDARAKAMGGHPV
jgi:hypothetical protein